MGDETRKLQGEIQLAVMRAVWHVGGGTVDEVRGAMPVDYEARYNTVQTTLNRLAERGLLVRTRGPTARGPRSKIVYQAALSEGEYLARSIEQTLAGASPEARRLAISQSIARLGEDEPPARRRQGRMPE